MALAALAGITAGCQNPHADAGLLVLAAASTSDALGAVGQAFEQEGGAKVSFSWGASHDLARQIRAGAPADVFVSADAETIDGLVADKLVLAEQQRTLMSNRLVVIVPRDSHRTVRGPEDLKDVLTVALGDPSTVPAGSYAKKWLERAGLWESLQDRVIPTLDVRAALAAVEAGRADAGIVYRTDAAKSPRVRVAYDVPPEALPPITYVAAVIARSKHPSASAFVQYLTGPRSRATFARRGFVL